MKITHRLAVIIGGVAIVAATGTVAAIAATQSHDPNVVGGRMCVQVGTNNVRYDWDSLPCGTGWYLDQETYSQPVIPPPPAPVLTRVNKLTVLSTNPATYQVTIPSGALLNEVLAVTWDSVPEVSVPFTASVTNSTDGDVTITFVGTPAQTPPAGATIYVTYGYTPQG